MRSQIARPKKRQVGSTAKLGKKHFASPGFLKAIAKKYAGLKIYKKLSVAFLAIALVSNLLIGAVGVYNLIAVNTMSKEMYDKDLSPLSPLYRIETTFLNMKSQIYGDDFFEMRAKVEDSESTLNKYLSEYSKTVYDPQEKQALHSMVEDISDLTVQLSNVFAKLSVGESDAARDILNGQVTKTTNHFDKTINQLYEKKINEGRQRNEDSSRNFQVALVTMGLITVLMTIGAAVMGRINAKMISKPIGKLVKNAEAISEGNLDVEIEKGSGDEISILSSAFEKVVGSLNLLKSDIGMLINGAVDGNLGVRADISRHKGAYADIIGGVNKLLNTITIPLNTAADYIDQIGSGKLPEKITDDFKGDFNRIKISLNTCIDSINRLIEDANMLADAAVEGNLSVRADVSRHNGDYAKIIEGVNSTLD